jgi:Golgi nucleoside diphosphatase
VRHFFFFPRVQFDAGSSGTRVYIYFWEHRMATDANKSPYTNPLTNPKWTLKANEPLSSFAGRLNDISGLFKPLMEHVETILNEQNPVPTFADIPIYLGATAGMRTLSEKDRGEIMTTTREVLSAYSFHVDDSNIRIISGEEEALFGWITVNYLKKTLVPDSAKVSALALAGRLPVEERVAPALVLPSSSASADVLRLGSDQASDAELRNPSAPTAAANADDDDSAMLASLPASVAEAVATLFAPSTSASSTGKLASSVWAAIAAFGAAYNKTDAGLPWTARAARALTSAAGTGVRVAHASGDPAPVTTKSAATLVDRFSPLSAAGETVEYWGAMDLGGASTQVIYVPRSDPISNHVDYIEPTGVHHNMYGVSHLGFGINMLLRRFYAAMVDAVPAEEAAGETPCFNTGYTAEITGTAGRKVTLTGTGKFVECRALALSILNPKAECFYDQCSVNGVYRPPIHDTARFVAFSTFPYIVQDAQMPFGFLTLNDIAAKGTSATCGAAWDTVKDKQRSTACMSLAYIHALLGDAYGFDAAKNQISFELEVEGQEVGWTTGMMIYHVNLLDFEGLKKAVVALVIVIIVFVILSAVLACMVAYLLYLRSKTTKDKAAPLITSGYAAPSDRVIINSA